MSFRVLTLSPAVNRGVFRVKETERPDACSVNLGGTAINLAPIPGRGIFICMNNMIILKGLIYYEMDRT